jgi:hypothetical protein
LHDDIERYLTLEQSEVNIDFWTVCYTTKVFYRLLMPSQNMMVVCKDRLDRIKANERMGTEAAAAVETDIAALLSGKTYEQLGSLQRQIQAKLTSGEPIDTDYWEALLKKLLVWKAKVGHLNISCNI